MGCYTLVVAEVAFTAAPERLRKGLARHPVPQMLLVRLAVVQAWQGRGLGAGLLKDATGRTLAAAHIVGIRALAVHAKDQSARACYRKFDCIEAPTDPLHLSEQMQDMGEPASLLRLEATLVGTSGDPYPAAGPCSPRDRNC